MVLPMAYLSHILLSYKSGLRMVFTRNVRETSDVTVGGDGPGLSNRRPSLPKGRLSPERTRHTWEAGPYTPDGRALSDTRGMRKLLLVGPWSPGYREPRRR